MVNIVPSTQNACCHAEGVRKAATDRELLLRFLAGDDSAFSEVVRRYAGLVINVCQRILRNPCDVEDAFQATFLVLARKARSLEWQDSIAGWLHQTARRSALKLRAIPVRRRGMEELFEIESNGNGLILGREDNDDGHPARQSFSINAETMIALDGKPAKLGDLPWGSTLTLRLSPDGQLIRAIKAASPEAEDDDSEIDHP